LPRKGDGVKKGPKRDKKTGRFVAKRSFSDKIFGKAAVTKTKDITPVANTGKRASGKKEGGLVEQLKNKRIKVGNQTVSIPVDKDGNVPTVALAMRFLQVHQGDRNGKIRNPSIDLATYANVTFKPDKNGKFRPEDIARWWLHPNEYDLEDIDNPGSNIFETLKDSRKGARASQRQIAVIAQNDGESNNIRKSLEKAFTNRELDAMVKDSGLTIFVDETLPGLGIYYPDLNLIILNSKAGPGTTIHEATHHLRKSDPERKNVISKSRFWSGNYTKDDETAEEATTTAETFIRLDPDDDNGYMSYYTSLFEISKDDITEENIAKTATKIKAVIDEDRKLFKGNAKRLRGKRAVNTLEKNFNKSNIGNLKLPKGKQTAKQYLNGLSKKD